MRFSPTLELGVLNGWLYFSLYLLIFGITLKSCSGEVRKRLYDRSLWDKRTKIIVKIGKLFSLVNIILIIFGVLAVDNPEFYIGNLLFILGLTILVLAIIHYRDAALDKPITRGLYRYSRNPQVTGIFIVFLGMVLVIGSWLNVILLSIAIISSHFGILGEEASLEKQYGESYIEFKKVVPRYFLFF